jgi:hypothetical protein
MQFCCLASPAALEISATFSLLSERVCGGDAPILPLLSVAAHSRSYGMENDNLVTISFSFITE